MAVKEFFAKLILGNDIHKDLAYAEKDVHEAKDKYNNACLVIDVVGEKNRLLSESLYASKQKMFPLQSEKESIDTLLSQLLNDEELVKVKNILDGRLNDKHTQLRNLKEKQCILKKIGKLKEEKTSLEHTIDNLSHEIELLKTVAQREKIRDNLLALKEKWQETLDGFTKRVVGADDLKSLEGWKRELEDYENRVKNAIEISVKESTCKSVCKDFTFLFAILATLY